ncbi:hypothetical protein [Saccharomonospora saliphila]|uniref:hypothetical protein n=1 Tax=Saccharomonospora saliphila TaxID=369829 RepID=UPI00048DE09A|nr:hypothetical protein [Saccharomonospora saliphila]
MRIRGVRAWPAAVVLSVAGLTTGCGEVNDAVEQVNSATDKASACSEALGIVDLNPNIDPEQVAANAGEKAERLRALGNEVADQTVQENLYDLADGYLELERRKLDHLDDFNGWLHDNLTRLDQLRQACL